MKEMLVDLQDYPPDIPVFHRTAVRGIVCCGEKLLMIYSRKYGDCKFPGGGAETGETHEETLIREMREETGRDVLPESVREGFVVHERRLGSLGDALFMDSYYYYCEIGEAVHAQDLQDYEIDEGYEVCWMTPAEALRRNLKVDRQQQTPWVRREIVVLQYLAEKEGQS